MRVFYPHVT